MDVPFDESLRAKTLAAIALIRELSARDVAPEPLPAELRHRCFGCSLAPICLPEETLYLIHQPEAEPGPDGTRPDEPAEPPSVGTALTRVIAKNDDKAVLYLHEPGSHVGRRSAHLVVSHRGQEINRVPIASIRQVVVFGNVQVSTQALHTLAEAEIPVSYLSGYGKFIAALVSPAGQEHGAAGRPVPGLLRPGAGARPGPGGRRRQDRQPADAPDAIAAELPGWRGSAQPPGHGRRARDGRPAARPSAPCDELGPVTAPATRATPRQRRAGRPGDGRAAGPRPERPRPRRAAGPGGPGRGAVLRQLRPDAQGPGPRRRLRLHREEPPPAPRPGELPCLSFAYALLAKDCFSAACTVGFDPYHGFYHVGRHGRPSLALDLMEEFRPVIADSVVLNLINNGMLTEGDFLTWRDACQLTDDGRAAFFKAYEQRKATEVTHPVFGYQMSYGRMLEVQARMLAAYVRGELPRYVGFTVR